MGMRSLLYLLARLLGDWSALSSGSPRKMARRIVNKAIGRGLVGRMWRR